MRNELPTTPEQKERKEYITFEQGIASIINFLNNSEKKPITILIFGLPNSGKSYFINQLTDAIKSVTPKKTVGHIDSYQSSHSYEYIDNFDVFLVHAGGATEYEEPHKTIRGQAGKKVDLTVYIHNDSIAEENPNIKDSENKIANKCDLKITNTQSSTSVRRV